MIDTKLSQLNTYKQISLSEEERGVLRAGIARQIQIARLNERESPWQVGVRHGLRIALSTFLFIVFVGGSVSVVADSSLPGDPLYSFKINVNEEIKGAFLSTPAEKLSWERRRIDNRLNEIKTLASTEALTKAKQAKAQAALDTHLAKVSAELATLSETEPTEALKVTADIEENLKVNKAAIETAVAAKTDAEKQQALETVDTTLKKISDEQVKIVSKELDKLAKDAADVPEDTGTIGDTTPPVTPPSP